VIWIAAYIGMWQALWEMAFENMSLLWGGKVRRVLPADPFEPSETE